jgi:arginase family enzyme
MMRVADAIGARGTVGLIDVTELAPVFDVSGTTARLAVCMVLRLMAAMAKARGELLDPRIRRSDLMKRRRK